MGEVLCQRGAQFGRKGAAPTDSLSQSPSAARYTTIFCSARGSVGSISAGSGIHREMTLLHGLLSSLSVLASSMSSSSGPVALRALTRA
ncbi:hypothetical protein DHOM_04620 [Dermabacter hominis 1368]|uniref:Uncharacterized protein n=1 Tax=Dermabacter hominis 1368 TaxID=1450519 RepID=A0ABR4SL92_9MICO|nr:hypothetical protein DHOM_04620 [Dermabacter hominis 1368]